MMADERDGESIRELFDLAAPWKTSPATSACTPAGSHRPGRITDFCPIYQARA